MVSLYSQNLIGREASRLADQITEIDRASFERTNERYKWLETPTAVKITLPSGRTLEISGPNRVSLVNQDQGLARSFEDRAAGLLWDAAALRVQEFRAQLESKLALRMADIATKPLDLSWSLVNFSGEFTVPYDYGLVTGLGLQSAVLEAHHEGLALYLYESMESSLRFKSWHLAGSAKDDLHWVSHSETGCRVTAMVNEVLDGCK